MSSITNCAENLQTSQKFIAFYLKTLSGRQINADYNYYFLLKI